MRKTHAVALCAFVLAAALSAPGRATAHSRPRATPLPQAAELPPVYACPTKPTPQAQRTLATMDRDMYCDVELNLRKLEGIAEGGRCMDAWRARVMSSILIFHPRCPRY